MSNSEPSVVNAFGQEWTRFSQDDGADKDLRELFEQYFAIFPWAELSSRAVGFDLGCGSGRWARFVAPRVGQLHCVEPSAAALEVATRNLKEFSNCEFHRASVEAIPLPDGSADFGYSLGVLHHVPDTQKGISDCVRKLKRGAPFLLYLYYSFDNRPAWFRALWKISDVPRRVISRLPFRLKAILCDVIAAGVYWPLARLSRMLEFFGVDVSAFPLSAYRKRSFYAMRTDALDRFGTRLEQRFSRDQIMAMMQTAGLERIRFSDTVFWCVLGYRSDRTSH